MRSRPIDRKHRKPLQIAISQNVGGRWAWLCRQVSRRRDIVILAHESPNCRKSLQLSPTISLRMRPGRRPAETTSKFADVRRSRPITLLYQNFYKSWADAYQDAQHQYPFAPCQLRPSLTISTLKPPRNRHVLKTWA